MASERQTVTLDSMMADFVADMVVADDELSDSIWTCVDNFIDDLCIKTMGEEDNIFETDVAEGDLPFNYIIDKVLEKVDSIVDISVESQMQSLTKGLCPKEEDERFNTSDPDYCEGIDFSEITPEEFQLYISDPNIDKEAEEDDDIDYDSVFNA